MKAAARTGTETKFPQSMNHVACLSNFSAESLLEAASKKTGYIQSMSSLPLAHLLEAIAVKGGGLI
jgi:hypothetical protein